MKYISDGTWFKKDTECQLITDLENETGIFQGLRVCENSEYEGGKSVGEEYIDQELCMFEEFIIKE